MRLNIIILFFILFNCLYGYAGSSSRYGYSARSFALSNAMIADQYHTFQSFSNPASLNQCDGTNYGISLFNMSLNRSIQTFYFSKELPGDAGLSITVLRTGVSDFMGKDSLIILQHRFQCLIIMDYYHLD